MSARQRKEWEGVRQGNRQQPGIRVRVR
jgi:hypothetical protein